MRACVSRLKKNLNPKFNNMKKHYSLDELLSKAASYCAISERCISEVMMKLKTWEVAEPDRKKIIGRLVDDDFINENDMRRHL